MQLDRRCAIHGKNDRCVETTRFNITINQALTLCLCNCKLVTFNTESADILGSGWLGYQQRRTPRMRNTIKVEFLNLDRFAENFLNLVRIEKDWYCTFRKFVGKRRA